MHIFRIAGLLLLIDCLCAVSSSKPRPLKVIISQWTYKASPIYYLKGAATEPLYRLEKEPADDSILLVDERKEVVIGRTTGLTFKTLDATNQKWISGRIESHFRLFGYKASVVWNGTKITMTGGKTRTFNDQGNQMLARCTMYTTKNQYDLEIFSDRLPDIVYIMALASHSKSLEKQ